MFESAIGINEFQCRQFDRIVNEIDESMMYVKSPGHGHTPVWIMGHLAIVGEVGQRYLGGRVSHANWLTLFGPGSADDPQRLSDDGRRFGRSEMIAAVDNAYQTLRQLASGPISDDSMRQPHGIDIFANTSIKTVRDVVTLLLTNHFGFHMSQLSSVRRAAGHGPLF